MRIYHIPSNFNDSGYAFNGMFKKRNLIDAAIFGSVAFTIASLIPLPPEISWTVRLTLTGVAVGISVNGIDDIPMTAYLIDLLHWLRRRDICFYNPHSKFFTERAADVILSQQQFGDSVANTIDRVSSAVHKRRPDYVEGENFQFADDPEQEMLQAFLDYQAAESAATESPEQKTTSPAPHDSQAQELNLDELTRSIILSDLPGTDGEPHV